MTDKLAAALDLARRGLPVFPLIENGKTPAFAGWQDVATTDEPTITAWFAGPHKRANIGVATGRGVMVVDADAKNGGRGVQSLALMEMLGADLDFVVETPSGGRHAYFTLPPDTKVPNSVRALLDYPDIDIRGEGGLVVAPGSTINGRAYKILRDGHLPAAQDWLTAAAIAAKKLRTKSDTAPAAELDLPSAIERAQIYLTQNAPLAIEGAGGDDTTYRVAAHIKDYGLSEDKALDLLDNLWNHRCSPPWDFDELEAKVSSAYSNGTSAPGAKSADAEFDVVEIGEKTNTSKRTRLFRVQFNAAAAAATAAANPSLVEDLIDQHSFAVIYGPSNSGKTFLALSIAYHVATGAPWAGHVTTKGAVLYVVAEGGRGINKRIAALKQHYTPQGEPPLDIIPCPVDLRSSDADVRRIVKLAVESAAAHGLQVHLIVVDTLSRALAGGDENTSTDMGAFVMNIDKLRLATSATVLVVHHTGKNVANGARGWSGLRAAIDTEIEVGEAGVISVEKQRDLEKIPDISFRLEIINLGPGPTGKDVTSCVLHPASGAEAEFEAQMDVPPLARQYFDCLVGTMQVSDWTAAFDAFLRDEHVPAVGDKTLQRLRVTLSDAGWVERLDKTQWRAVTP